MTQGLKQRGDIVPAAAAVVAGNAVAVAVVVERWREEGKWWVLQRTGR